MPHLLLPYEYFFFFSGRHFALSDYPPFKKQKHLVAQAQYSEEAYLDFLSYFVLFEHEAAISTPCFFYQIFFIHL